MLRPQVRVRRRGVGRKPGLHRREHSRGELVEVGEPLRRLRVEVERRLIVGHPVGEELSAQERATGGDAVEPHPLLLGVPQQHKVHTLNSHLHRLAAELELGRSKSARRLAESDLVVWLARGRDQFLGDAVKTVARPNEARRKWLQLDGHAPCRALRPQALHDRLDRSHADADEQNRQEDQERERAAKPEAIRSDETGESDGSEDEELHGRESSRHDRFPSWPRARR
jgi:hypothetical protein